MAPRLGRESELPGPSPGATITGPDSNPLLAVLRLCSRCAGMQVRCSVYGTVLHSLRTDRPEQLQGPEAQRAGGRAVSAGTVMRSFLVVRLREP